MTGSEWEKEFDKKFGGMAVQSYFPYSELKSFIRSLVEKERKEAVKEFVRSIKSPMTYDNVSETREWYNRAILNYRRNIYTALRKFGVEP